MVGLQYAEGGVGIVQHREPPVVGWPARPCAASVAIML
jgi:hypothetical protein